MNSLGINTSIEEFKKVIDKNDRLIVLDFYATWCRPCKMLTPALMEMAADNTDVAFYKVDVDTNQDISQQFKIKCMPTIIFLKNKVIHEKMEGNSLSVLEGKLTYDELDRIEGLDVQKIKNSIEKYK